MHTAQWSSSVKRSNLVTKPAIRFENLSKRFGATLALSDLNLEVAPGEVVGYLGPNGAGKTTTIRLLLGLVRPTAGRAEIFGLDSQRQTVEAHRRLAYVPGEANLWPSLTGIETSFQRGRSYPGRCAATSWAAPDPRSLSTAGGPPARGSTAPPCRPGTRRSARPPSRCSLA